MPSLPKRLPRFQGSFMIVEIRNFQKCPRIEDQSLGLVYITCKQDEPREQMHLLLLID